MKSLCERCKAPGMCCHGFLLYDGANRVRTYWEDEGDEAVLLDMKAEDLPFTPLAVHHREYDEVEKRWWRSMYMQCPRLGADGLCTAYDKRPELCRTYRAGMEVTCRMSPRFQASRIYHLTEILGGKPSVFEDRI